MRFTLCVFLNRSLFRHADMQKVKAVFKRMFAEPHAKVLVCAVCSVVRLSVERTTTCWLTLIIDCGLYNLCSINFGRCMACFWSPWLGS